MLEIATGVVRAYYLLDVADTIDLAAMGADAAKGLAPAEFPLRPHTSPAYLQFPLPPLAGRLPEATIGDLHCDVRVKYFDYGVISLRLTFDAKGTWDELVALQNEYAPTNESPNTRPTRACVSATRSPRHSTTATTR